MGRIRRTGNFFILISRSVKAMRKVLTYGTFDLLHWGHINLLKRAKDLGDYLIVGLSGDEFNAIKNKNHTTALTIEK